MNQPPYPQGPTPPYRPGPPPPPPRKSNTTLIVLLIVGGLIVLCCGGGMLSALGRSDDRDDRPTTTRPAPAAAPRTSSPAPSQALSTDDLAFIAALNVEDVPMSSPAAAIELGHTVCDARRAGNSAAAVGLQIAKQGYRPEHAGYIVGAAQSAYCPELR